MEELNKEEIERINNVLSTYKDGFESGTLIKTTLLNVGKPNKNEDVFISPKTEEVVTYWTDSNGKRYAGIGWNKFGSGNYS